MRKKIIKWLGGYPKEEVAQFGWRCTRFGRTAELERLQTYMRDINGEDAEAWCDYVWKFVCERLEDVKRETP